MYFDRAMNAMHVLYAHVAVTRVIHLEDLIHQSEKASPPAFIDIYYEEGKETGKFGPQPFSKLQLNDTPYNQRGWCVAECQWMSTREVLQGIAPMTPERFRQRVELGRDKLPGGWPLTFTHRADEEIVMHLQEKVFERTARVRKEMRAMGLQEEEQLNLAEALPHFLQLSQVKLSSCQISEKAGVALGASLKSVKQPTRLNFFKCAIDDQAAAALARGLVERQGAEQIRVRLSMCNISEEAAAVFKAVEGVEVGFPTHRLGGATVMKKLLHSSRQFER